MKSLFFALMLISTSLAFAQPFVNQYEAIDSYAIATPKNREVNLSILVKHLTATAQNDEEKVRAIFTWIKDRIAYDQKGYESSNEKRRIISVEEVLKKRQAVCAGYANLFVAMAERARLEAKRVDGVTNDYFTTRGKEKEKQFHSWNAVKLDKEWQLLDITWGLWLTPPEEMILTHLPDNSEDQLLRRSISTNDFKRGRIDPKKIESKYR